MKFKQVAIAFLFHKNQVLLMKKKKHLRDGIQFWSPLGGHLEQEELNHPKIACLREIHEESGIPMDRISELNLRYILFRLKGNEVRQAYVYFGKTDCTDYVESDEGELCWVDCSELRNMHFTKIVQLMLEDYLNGPSDDPTVKVGVISLNDGNEPVMQWSELKDPLVF